MDWGGLLYAIGKFLGKNLVENASKEVIKHFPLTKSTIPAKKQYISACLKINNLLYENKKLFVENCPFLDLESDGIVEVDNWYQIQERMLNPNNLKILYLIEDIENIIPENKKEIFLKIKQHIHSFDAHIKDRNIDYTMHQFPEDFSNYIADLAYNVNKKNFEKISKWLKQRINKNKIQITKLYYFGSSLFNDFKNISDIDIIFYLDIDNIDFVKLKEQKESIVKEFNKKFKKELHLTIFLKSEKDDLLNFLNNLYFYTELL